VVDGAEVRVAQGRRRFRFLLEALEGAGVVDLSADLEGDLAVEARVGGEVDGAHAALTELAHDPVSAELFRQANTLHGRHRRTPGYAMCEGIMSILPSRRVNATLSSRSAEPRRTGARVPLGSRHLQQRRAVIRPHPFAVLIVDRDATIPPSGRW